MEENLNDSSREKEEERQSVKNIKWPFKAKLLIAILIFIIITLAVIILLITLIDSDDDKENGGKKNNENDRYQKAGYIETWNDLFGIVKPNLSYVKSDVIINSFKKGGENYNETIGNVNEGNDYPKNDRNYYTLYVPYSSKNNKDKFNGIFLYIHGGSWTHGFKEDIEFLCSRYAKMGYITATMGYTVLSGDYEQYNIYRILDEITAAINSIIEELEDMGFDRNKLELAIGGISAGAHISLLYGYTIKNSPLPIKFLINIVGPLSLEPEFWYKPAEYNNTLENIEPSTVENAISEGKIVKIFSDTVLVGLMNGFLGKIFSEEEVEKMIVNNTIDKDNPKYQEMFQKVKNSFPIKFVNNETLPTLCEYAGNDTLVGVAQYRFLKEYSEKYGNQLDLVYMRFANHDLISYDTEDGIKAMRDIHYQILSYAQKYFTHEK